VDRTTPLAPERHRKIVELLSSQEYATHAELLAVTGTSIATLRRDLQLLERSGTLRRLRGGATRLREPRTDDGDIARLLLHGLTYLRCGDLDATAQMLRRALTSCERMRATRYPAGRTRRGA
jgi:hypothetical protein